MAHTISKSTGFSGEEVRQAGKGLASEFLTTFKRLSNKLKERAQRARDLRELENMSDRELRDMGISSSDIYRVIDGDFERNR